MLATPTHHPEISVVALQMMPDHLHAILFVKEKMKEPLGMALRGFKQKCNQHYRELILGVSSVALATQQTRQASQNKDRRGEDRTHGLLFTRGFNDRLLLREGQLQRWLDYLHDNPRRLLMKREQPELFRVKRNVIVAGQQFSAIGNLFPAGASRQAAGAVLTASDGGADKRAAARMARAGKKWRRPGVTLHLPR